jgi:formate dehydrogenase major subunit
LLDYIQDYRRRAGITPETGTRIVTAGEGNKPAHTEPGPPEGPE